MQKIRIDFDNPGLPQHISAVENDSQSRFFQATLYENGKAYTAPEGATYSIMYRGFGPQNQGWYDTINDGAGKRAACAVSGNVVTCEIARQALQVPGHVSIVLCVTTGKGYMLKSWPIECDCKNDRYDSTAEIQSFFYITQVTNADWSQAIQAWENLKDAVDPTLSVSGKAADAAKVGEAINAEAERAKGVENQLKESLANISVDTDITLSVSGKAADAAKVGEAVNAESERAKGVEGQIKEDLGDLTSKVGHASSNLLKITGYEITTPNEGVSFSLSDDGKITMNGNASGGNFAVKLNCKEVQLNKDEFYTINSSAFINNLFIQLMRKVPIDGTSLEVAIGSGKSKTWAATNSVVSYITIMLSSGSSVKYDGYIWFSKGAEATSYETPGFITEVAKKTEVEGLKTSVGAAISELSDDIYERCGLVEKKGVFEPFAPNVIASGVDVVDAPFAYSRFNNPSKKIIVKPTEGIKAFNFQQSFTFGAFDTITVLMYIPVHTFNNRAKLQFYLQLASSRMANKQATAIFVDSALLNVGWGAYKIPLSAFNFLNATIDNMDLLSLKIRTLSSITEDFEVICGGYIYNERMKPTVVMSFDGVYNTDTVENGKFDALVKNGIHATMFQSANTSYSDETKKAFYGHVINNNFEVQMYATANRDYVQTEEAPEKQYNELRTQKEWLYENRICGLPQMYAAPNGILPNTTMKLLKSLGFKMARSGSCWFVSRFTDKDFNVGFKGIYGTNTADTVKNMIDEAITDGKAIFLFTHEVKDNPTSYDSGIANFSAVCDYIGEKIESGELQSLNFTEFYNACVN